MQLMKGEKQLVEAVNWLEQNLTFDLDERVHVFELTIRALGELRISISISAAKTTTFYM